MYSIKLVQCKKKTLERDQGFFACYFIALGFGKGW